MDKLIAVLSMSALCFAIGILTMIYGWGLKPESWWWVIGGGVVARLIAEVILGVAKK